MKVKLWNTTNGEDEARKMYQKNMGIFLDKGLLMEI